MQSQSNAFRGKEGQIKKKRHILCFSCHTNLSPIICHEVKITYFDQSIFSYLERILRATEKENDYFIVDILFFHSVLSLRMDPFSQNQSSLLSQHTIAGALLKVQETHMRELDKVYNSDGFDTIIHQCVSLSSCSCTICQDPPPVPCDHEKD